METAMFKGRKTKVTEVPNGRRWFLARIILLIFCLCLFSSDAMALYSIFNSGVSDVNGIGSDGDLLLDGGEFGSVIVIASSNDAYSIYSRDANITIDGLFDTVGIITATAAGSDNAFGLFTPNGSIYTDGLDGTINSQAEDYWAVGLFSPFGDVNTADIGGTISSQVGENWAVGLYGQSINTGDIDGVINAVASDSYAFGLFSDGITSIHTGDINGTIYAEATYGSNAYGMYSSSDITVGNIGSDANIVAIAEIGGAYGFYSGAGDSIHIGNIDGKITADVNDGSGAYAMYSDSNITTGNIGSTALIGARGTNTVVPGSAYGMYSGNSITIGDVNGTIYAEMIDGSDAFAIYAINDVTIGDIGSDANIWAKADGGVAVGISSGGVIDTLRTGDIAGRITADVNDGFAAFAMQSTSDIVVDGNITSTAVIGATATGGIELSAYGMYSGDSITIGDVNGTIYAEKPDGSGAYAIYAVNDVTIGDIGSDANIWAAAEYGDAYGIYSGGGITTLTTGDIAGRITADVNNGSDAYAMYSMTDIIVDGNITSTAVIGATASGLPPSAYGMYSDNSITIGDVNGTIYAEKTDSMGAYAIYAANDVTVGNIGSDANIWAAAEYGNAYGIYSGSGGPSIHTGDIDGNITADVNDGSNAYGMYSYWGITTGNIGSDANISATAGQSNAYAIYSSNGSIDINDIDGIISAQAINGSNAYGLYSGAGDSIHIDDVNGTITADANQSNAYAMWSYETIEVGNIESDANISATAGQNYAYGLYSNNGSIYTGDIDGVITADANGYAYGMSSGSVATIYTGDISGTITADANDSYAYGMYSSGDIVIDGNITSNALISATAGTNYAFGLNSAGGGGSIHIGDVNGVITADANDGSFAYALYSLSGITTGNIGSDANISATAGENNAYAIYSTFDDVNVGDIDGTITTIAGSSYAAGLRASNGSVYTGDINGTITAMAEDGYAWGLYSSDVTSIHVGDINGVIIADVNDGSYAYGMYSTSSITTGNILSDALISASAAGNYAYGLYSGGGASILTGDIDGTITATSGGNDAGGLYSLTGSVTTGNINGVISATAAGLGNDTAYGIYGDGSVTIGDVNGVISAEMTNGTGAYAIRSNTDITTGDITNNALISAMAEYGDAYGLYSGGGQTITTGDVNGVIIADANDGSRAYGMYSTTSIMTGNIGSDANITATANGWHARGLYSGNGDIDTNDIDGKITVSVGENYAYALHSVNGDINTDDIGSTAVITATSDRSRAYGLYSEDGDINTGDINGTINVTAGDMYAYGLYSSEDGSINIGDVNGVITATANYQAYGLFSEGSSTITTGDINGTISATSATETAYGLRTWGDIITGDITGTITATSAERKAAGIFNEGTLTTTVSGTITAYSDADFVYGILSYGPMDVLIDGGDVNAVAAGGPYAAAIQSGRMGSLAIGLQTQDADDTVGIVAGSTIVGDVDLARFGSDDDLLTLSGVNSNSTTFADDINNVETIDITGGTWYVDGTVYNSTNGITMYGGVLGGTGTLCSLYVIDGIFAPGHSIDTIDIVGEWTHDPGGIYEVEVNNAEEADLANVIGDPGTANLDGTIRGKAIGERIDHSFSALVIDANNLNGMFADVNGTTLFPIYSVTYDQPNSDVYLNVEFDYAYYARTGNQRAVGQAFNWIVSGGRDTGDMNDVLTAIEHLPNGNAANEAYNQLMPQDMLGLPDVTRQIMNTHNDGIMERMDNRRRAGQFTMLENNRYLLADAGNSFALPSQTDEWMPFVKGIGMWADRDAATDIAGYKYSVYGVVAGMDKQVSDNSLFGFGIGGLMTSVDYSRGSTKADIDSLLLSLHGSYFEDDWHIDYTAGYGHSWYDQQRGITFLNRTAKSDHTSDAFSVEVEYGQNLGGTSGILEPVAGMGYTFVREGGYTESEAGAANLKVDSENFDGFYSKLGIQATAEMQFENNPDMVMVPKLSAFWIHDFADRVELSSSFIGGGNFTTEGLDPIRDMLNVGAGLNVYLINNTRLFVDYIWQYSSDFQSNMLQAGLQWPF